MHWTMWIAVGIAIGTVSGVWMERIPVGMALGAGLGAAIAAWTDTRHSGRQDGTHSRSDRVD